MSLCECGCGQLAPVIQKNNTKRGYVKGEYHRFLPNHQTRTQDQVTRVGRGFSTVCWILPNKPGRLGYVRLRGRQAHVVYWERFNGPVPDGLELDHLCRQRDCVNPDHLEPVTHAENIRRSIHVRKTHCPQGHEYTPENTYVYRGCWHCRSCNRARSLAYFRRQKATL